MQYNGTVIHNWLHIGTQCHVEDNGAAFIAKYGDLNHSEPTFES